MKLKSLILVTGAAGALLASGTVVALATPGSGIAATILAKGTLAQPAHVETSDIHFHSNTALTLVTQRVELQPGGSSGWHMHPGLVLATVTQGTVTLHGSSCDTQAYSATESFMEPAFRPVMVTNDTGAVADFVVTYAVPAGSIVRIDSAAPDCAG
jgi:hypothetical protein